MTTVLVFAPVLFVEEEAGQLYSDIAIAVSTAILASMLYAVAVVPAASAHFGAVKKQALKAANSGGMLLRSIYWVGSTFFNRLVILTVIPYIYNRCCMVLFTCS